MTHRLQFYSMIAKNILVITHLCYVYRKHTCYKQFCFAMFTGHHMKLIYYVSPYDLLCKQTKSSHTMTVEGKCQCLYSNIKGKRPELFRKEILCSVYNEKGPLILTICLKLLALKNEQFVFVFVLTISNEVAYLTLTSIFHKAFNVFSFDCEITFESIPGTNQYLAITVKFLAQGKNGSL